MRADSGQAAFATLGFTIVMIALVGFAIDVSGVLLVDRRLQAAADTAALAGATGVATDWVAGDSRTPLDAVAATRQVGEALHRLGFDGEVRDVRVGDTSVEVEIERSHRPALLSLLGMAEIRLVAESRAVVRTT